MRQIDKVNASHAPSPCQRRGDKPAGLIEDEEIVRIEHRIEFLTRQEFVNSGQHRNPVVAVALRWTKLSEPVISVTLTVVTKACRPGDAPATSS